MRQLLSIVTLLMLSLCINAQSQQEWRDSLSTLNKQINVDPSNVVLRLKKAALNVELGQWQNALDEYSNVLDLEPDNLTALYYRGYVNQHMQRYSFARLDYEKVLSTEPQNQHALMGLILTNMADGHVTAAFDGANQLVEMTAGNAESLALRADVEQQLGMTDAALDDISRAIEQETEVMKSKYPTEVDDDITAYQLTAFSLYMAKGDRKRARRCLDALTDNGMPKAYLAPYYNQLKAKQ